MKSEDFDMELEDFSVKETIRAGPWKGAQKDSPANAQIFRAKSRILEAERAN